MLKVLLTWHHHLEIKFSYLSVQWYIIVFISRLVRPVWAFRRRFFIRVIPDTMDITFSLWLCCIAWYPFHFVCWGHWFKDSDKFDFFLTLAILSFTYVLYIYEYIIHIKITINHHHYQETSFWRFLQFSNSYFSSLFPLSAFILDLPSDYTSYQL